MIFLLSNFEGVHYLCHGVDCGVYLPDAMLPVGQASRVVNTALELRLEQSSY